VSPLGFNTGYIDELYRQYLADPDSVSESWQEFFSDYRPNETFVSSVEAPADTGDGESAEEGEPPVVTPSAEQPAQAPAARQGDGAVEEAIKPASAPAVDPDAADVKPIRGPAGKIVENMEASLGVPTATSVRDVPVKLLAENRQLINEYQRYIGGEKVSYTHIIAYAVVRALQHVPNMNTTFRHENGTPQHIIPKQINLGLAIDIERRGKRTLLVPNVKDAGALNFAQFLGAYNDLIRRARGGDLEIDDFMGTTATITNPGMIGTSLSVARLMPGQGVIVGVGSIGYPPEYHAYPPEMVSKMGLAQVMNITSTYDHRVIQGAQSGAFLAHISELLLGHHGFYADIFGALNIPYQPYTLNLDSTPQLGDQAGDEMTMVEKEAKVLQLIRAYRVRGHLQADVNPLGHEGNYHPELDPSNYGLTIWDLDRNFVTGGLGGKEELPLRDILDILRQTYTRKVGVEFMHISDPNERRWLQERIEPTRMTDELTPEQQRRILTRLNAAEAFERFIHTKYIGHKRFSLEGSETMIPILDTLLSDAAEQEVGEVVVGMAHRGRLNVLANILGKPYETIFSEFEGSIDPNTTQGSGDVKYHLGSRGTYTSPHGSTVDVTLASNPSHLEAVNPVVEGMVRARQEALRRQSHETSGGEFLNAIFPLLIHGDAAFAGQGVVAETLNLSQLRGYKTGGTVHLVINNQIGFTTLPSDARSSTYATDIARMIQAPIFHVNGDDPEACIRVARLALDYRQVFNKDVVIDMLCYRVHGHNEGDEPTYTQPLLYEKIEAQRSPRKIYTESLLRRGAMEPDQAEQLLDDYRAKLQEAFERTEDVKERDPEDLFEDLEERRQEERTLPVVDTAAQEEHLAQVVEALVNLPEDFNVHHKLERQFKRRDKLFHEDGRIDWAFAEILAFGTMLLEGISVRLSGQDSRRATFSQRHAVLYDQETGGEYIPLNNMNDAQERLLIFDSLLSEYAVCGFEYGYSVADPSALVLWEAQFGDFANGAQIVFDQFLSAAEEKWGQTSSLVLLLPHGYEGQGPEHSSARLERFLQLCAEDNMVVANFSTPANYFHALRRQVKRDVKKPLVVMTPKSLLRNPRTVSPPADLTEGTVQEVIPASTDSARAERLVFCSGKVYYDLMKALEDEEAKAERIAVARIEQFYPFPKADVRREMARYEGVKDVVWLQEEPRNMGPWTFLQPRLNALLEDLHDSCEHRVRYVGRPASASPATGSAKVHQLEQDAIMDDVLAL